MGYLAVKSDIKSKRVILEHESLHNCIHLLICKYYSSGTPANEDFLGLSTTPISRSLEHIWFQSNVMILQYLGFVPNLRLYLTNNWNQIQAELSCETGVHIGDLRSSWKTGIRDLFKLKNSKANEGRKKKKWFLFLILSETTIPNTATSRSKERNCTIVRCSEKILDSCYIAILGIQLMNTPNILQSQQFSSSMDTGLQKFVALDPIAT